MASSPLAADSALPATRQGGRDCCRPVARKTLVATLLVLGAALAGSVPGFSQAATDQAQAPGDTSSQIEDDEQSGLQNDDGSSVLPNKPSTGVDRYLQPVTPLEERQLLGNWGDSADEDED